MRTDSTTPTTAEPKTSSTKNLHTLNSGAAANRKQALLCRAAVSVPRASAWGVLQALANYRWLPSFDYLSTVSGGGYIGASLTYLLHQSTKPGAPKFDVWREHFPYLSFPMVSAPSDATESFTKGRLLQRLRQHAKYLTPGRGINVHAECRKRDAT